MPTIRYSRLRLWLALTTVALASPLSTYSIASMAVRCISEMTRTIGLHDTIEQVWQQVHPPDRVAACIHHLPLLLWQMVGDIQHDHPGI